MWETWNVDKPDRMAASLAYFGMFSFVPLFYVGLAVAGLVLNNQAVWQEVGSRLSRVLGTDVTAFIVDQLAITANRQEGLSVLSGIIGLGSMLYVASGLFVTLEDMLNTIWHNPFPTEQGILAVVRQQFVGFALVIAVGLSFVIMTATTFVIGLLGGTTEANTILGLANLIVSFVSTTVAFALLYHLLARVKPSWGAIWTGAFAAALLWTIGKLAFGLLLQFSNIQSAFAAASTLAVVLLGIYYGALMFLAGAMLIRGVTIVRAKQNL